MTGTTAFAILCGFAAALPAAFSQALIGLIWIAATGWLVTGLFFAQGDQRAFCIGAIIVISSTWTRIGGRFLQGVSQIFALLVGNVTMPRAVVAWLDLALLVAVAVFNGWLCIVAQRYFRRQAEE